MSATVKTREDAVRMLWQRRARSLVLVGIFFSLPLLAPLQGRNFVLGWALCSAMVGLSMNVLVGYAGQISLAHAVLFGTGAFTIGNLATRQEVPWVIALPLAGLVTAAIALLIGFPALRIRGLNLAIATLGFQFAMQRVIFRVSALTGGAAGIDIEPLFGNTAADERAYLWVIMACFLGILLLDRNLTRSKLGRAFFAVRQDEQVAASFGMDVSRTKLMAFAISGFYAGIAGALFGTLQGDVTNELFDYIYSVEFLVFAVLGGLGSRVGTAIGAAFPVLYRQFFDFLASTGPMLGGALLVATLIRYPGGMAAQGREISHLGHMMRKAGVRFYAMFLGAILLSVAIATAVAIPLWRILGADSFWAIVVFLVVLGGVFQTVSRLLARRAHVTITRKAALAADGIAPVQTHALATTTLRVRTHDLGTTPLLEVDNLSIRFGGVRALDGVSMSVRSGELIGIMGPNGSGKTTMLNNVSGFLTPNEGDIRFRGQSVLGMPPHKRAALGLGRTFQNVGLVKQETVADNFLIAQHLACRYGALEGLVRTGNVTVEERRLKARAAEAIALLGLEDIVDAQVRSLPHGRAKLVELGCALVTGPELLLLDEPAAGVGPQEADALGQALKDIAEQFGVTILMIEHHVPLMLSTCDYIYVLNFGKLLTHGLPMEVARHPDVIAAYLGSAGKEASLAASEG